MTASAWRFLLAPFGGSSATPDTIIDAFGAELNQGDWYLDQHVLYRMCVGPVTGPPPPRWTPSLDALACPALSSLPCAGSLGGRSSTATTA